MNDKIFLIVQTCLGFTDIKRICNGESALIRPGMYPHINIDEPIYIDSDLLRDFIDYVDKNDGRKVVINEEFPPIRISNQTAVYGLIKVLLEGNNDQVTVEKSNNAPINKKSPMIVVKGVPKNICVGEDEFKKFINELMKTLDKAEERFDNNYTTKSTKKLKKYASKTEKLTYLNKVLGPEMNEYFKYLMATDRPTSESRVCTEKSIFMKDVNLTLLDWLYQLKKYKIKYDTIPYMMVDCRADSLCKLLTKNFVVTNTFDVNIPDPLDMSRSLISEKHTMVFDRYTACVIMTYVKDKNQYRFEKDLIYLDMDRFPSIKCTLDELVDFKPIKDKLMCRPTHDYPWPRLIGLLLTFNSVKLYNAKGKCYRTKVYPMVYDIQQIRWEGRTVSDLTHNAVEYYDDVNNEYDDDEDDD